MNTKRNEYDLLSVFEDFFSDIDRIWAMPQSSTVYNCAYPPLDLLINKKSKDLKFKFALAGFSKEAISLSFEGDYLQLKVDPDLMDKASSDFEIIQKGIKLSKITKKFYVPNAKYQSDKIEVSFESGILEVGIPAKEEMKARKINIK